MCTQQELDLLCEQAVELRREGRSRREIKEILGPMSNATLNDALKGEPPPAERTSPRYAESKRQAADGVRRYRAAERSAREEARRAAIGAAAAQIQGLTEREIIVAEPSRTGARARRASRTGSASTLSSSTATPA